MGKAATREKAKRRRYFKNLAGSNPERFVFEWEKRLSSWLFLINERAGRLSDDEGNPVPPVSAIVDEALSMLEACGEEVFQQYGGKTFDLLTSQCCRSLSVKAFPQFFRVASGKRMCERPAFEGEVHEE